MTDRFDAEIEKQNKDKFRLWLETHAETNGSTEKLIHSIENIYLPVYHGRNLFFTSDISDVQFMIEQLNHKKKKNSAVKKALHKYYEYLLDELAKYNADEIYEHNLYGICIRQKNTAVSEKKGWLSSGDLSEIRFKEDLLKLYNLYYGENLKFREQVLKFFSDMQLGDYIVFAENDIFHIGRIEADYYYENIGIPFQNSDCTNNRKLVWLKKNIHSSDISVNFQTSLKSAISLLNLNDYKSAVSEVLKGVYIKKEPVKTVLSELNYNTSIETEFERNRLIFGAPGTGKSFRLKKDCEKLLHNTDGSFERVTFHPDYTYSQFVGAYKPVSDKNSIQYKFVPGPFMRVLKEALKSGRTENPQPYVLIIEEINRAKASAVFGDIFQLLDRDDDGVSEYEIQTSEEVRNYLASELGGESSKYGKIKIPDNMFIWSTMNSADQGVFQTDTAFKRRWDFEYIGINQNEPAEKIYFTVGRTFQKNIEWNALRRAINEKLAREYKINEDKLIGPFFISGKIFKNIDDKRFSEIFKNKIIMYLYEDAARQYRHKLFSGCYDTTKYSVICECFDDIGIRIFGEDFEEIFYNCQVVVK